MKINVFSPSLYGQLLRSMLAVTGAVVVLGACSTHLLSPYNSQLDLPEGIRVPTGNQAVLEAQGKGTLHYECQAVRRAPREYAWLLRNTALPLSDTYGHAIVYYPGLQSRWVHSDGSQVLAREFVEVSNDDQSLPLQRARAEPSAIPGALKDISYVQNLRTHGGVVTSKPCVAGNLGMRVSVPYEADYVFWRPAV